MKTRRLTSVPSLDMTCFHSATVSAAAPQGTIDKALNRAEAYGVIDKDQYATLYRNLYQELTGKD